MVQYEIWYGIVQDMLYQYMQNFQEFLKPYIDRLVVEAATPDGNRPIEQPVENADFLPPDPGGGGWEPSM